MCPLPERPVPSESTESDSDSEVSTPPGPPLKCSRTVRGCGCVSKKLMNTIAMNCGSYCWVLMQLSFMQTQKNTSIKPLYFALSLNPVFCIFILYKHALYSNIILVLVKIQKICKPFWKAQIISCDISTKLKMCTM